MTTITVKNIPDDLYAKLKETAQADRRSINSEIMPVLRKSFGNVHWILRLSWRRLGVLRKLTSQIHIHDKESTRQSRRPA